MTASRHGVMTWCRDMASSSPTGGRIVQVHKKNDAECGAIRGDVCMYLTESSFYIARCYIRYGLTWRAAVEQAAAASPLMRRRSLPRQE
jgi:hypothetical protein